MSTNVVLPLLCISIAESLHITDDRSANRIPKNKLICDEGTAPVGSVEWERKQGCDFTSQLFSERLPLLPIWHGKVFPLVHKSIKAASAPGGHEGADKRFQLAVDRLIRGDPLVISVLGGSMTHGHGTRAPWPKVFENLSQSLGYNVTVHNLAQPATTSKWATRNIQDLRQRGLGNSHLVIVDYAINDNEKAAGERRSKDVRKSFTDLMSLLIDLENRPAVIAVETFNNLYNQLPECSNFSTRAYYNHWDVLEQMSIPTVCFMSAICSSNTASPREWWFGGLSKPDAFQQVHPGDATHDLVARTVLGAFLNKMESVCAHGGPKGLDYPKLAPRSEALQCLSKPTAYHHAMYGKEAFAPASNTTWKFEEDVPGKPGWIATGLADIEFAITTHSGWLQFEFLGTYKDIGSATVWVDTSEPGKWDTVSMPKPLCQIDGLWDDHTSQSRFSLMRVAPGDHVVHLRSKGPKFKLLGLVAC
mmetsp:Transcript_79841/g.226380  ORF Transcript_79841/g.226380 Transcript_79841/m.226380 type:complete len:475 (+) Transcript_79841:69-1493(+)